MLMYDAPWIRCQVYIIGILTGYFLRTVKKIRIPWVRKRFWFKRNTLVGNYCSKIVAATCQQKRHASSSQFHIVRRVNSTRDTFIEIWFRKEYHHGRVPPPNIVSTTGFSASLYIACGGEVPKAYHTVNIFKNK